MKQYVWHWSLKPLLMTVFHLARNGNHEICLLSMLCEGIMREDMRVLRWYWFLLCVLRLAGLPEMQLCKTFRSCAYIIMSSTEK